MHPFPGAIGRFWMHGAGILPSRAAFRVEGSEIMHGAKNLPALLGLFVTAACSLVEWALPPHRPYLVCLTHERTPAILVALTAIVITPCRRLAIAAPPARCPRLTRTPLRPPIPLPRAPPTPAPPACDRRRSRHPAARSPPAPPTPRRHRAPVACPPHLALPRGPRCSSGNSREMVR